MLIVEGLQTAYGDSRVLFGIDFKVAAGEVVALLGRNGMGKTTTIRSIFGLVRPTAGRISWEGADITGAEPHIVGRLGIGLVPEGRQIFPRLTVEENLVATANRRSRNPRWTLDSTYALFPDLKKRRRNLGNALSGGEQQMLAIGRALMTNPKLLVLDEATEGLAPLVRTDIWNCLQRLKEEGEAILVVDKNVDALIPLADRHLVLEKGRIVWNGTSADLQMQPDIKDRFLHL